MKGVISFSLFEEKAVVRAIVGEQEILKSIREVPGLVRRGLLPSRPLCIFRSEDRARTLSTSYVAGN